MNDEQNSVLKILVEIVDQVTEPLRKINESMEEFSNAAYGWWTSAAEAFAGYEAIKGLVEPAMNMAEAQTRLGLTGKFSAEQLANLKDQANALSEKFPKNAESLMAAETELAKRFSNFGDIQKGTEIAAKFSTVLGVDAAEGATILADAVEQLGDTTKPVTDQMRALGDQLSFLRNAYPMNTGRLVMDIQQLGRASATMNIPLTQTLALYGTLAKLGEGGRRGPGMVTNEIINSIGHMTKGGYELQKYGLIIQKYKNGQMDLMGALVKLSQMKPPQLRFLEAHLPQEAEALSRLLKNIPTLDKTFFGLKNSTGEMDTTAKKLADTPLAKIQKLVDTLQVLADTVSSALLPNLTKVVDVMSKWTTAIDKFLGQHPALTEHIGEMVLGFGALLSLAGAWKFLTLGADLVKLAASISGVTALLPMLGSAAEGARLALGGAATAGEAFNLVLMSNPVGWAIAGSIAGLALLSFLGYETWEHWDKVKQVLEEVRTVAEGLFKDLWHSSLLNKLDSLVNLGTSNYAGLAGNITQAVLAPSPSVSSSSSTQHIHYNPQVTVNVAPGVSMAQAAKEFNEIMHGQMSELTTDMAEQRRRENRLTFQDTTNPLFAR